MRVLVAEDNLVVGRLIGRMLETMGLEVTLAEDGLQAWEILQCETFEIILSDWEMPRMDGAELCRKIRSQENVPYIYFIMLSARDGREDKLEGLKAGADDFIVKPPNPAELVARLQIAQRIVQMQTEGREHSDQLQETMKYLQIANMRFSQLFLGLPVACVTCDMDGRIQEWNHACVKLFGIEEISAVQKYLWETIYSADEESMIKEDLRMIRIRNISDEVDLTYMHPDGYSRNILRYVIPIYGEDSIVVGCIRAYVDITARKRLESELNTQLLFSQKLNKTLEEQRTELAAANARLSEMATTDPLTLLANRRHFWEKLEADYSYARRHNLPLCLIMLDVDHFKSYNDSFGHPQGDELLKTLAGLICDTVRKEDIPARYGGEEFVIILPSTDKVGAEELAERVRTEVCEYKWSQRTVTVSIGVSCLLPEMNRIEDLIDLADKALYLSKHGGRNRVTCAWKSDDIIQAA